MKSTALNVILCIGFLCKASVQQKFKVPDSTVELLYPKGFTVSIPETPGIRSFEFHGKLNEKFKSSVARQNGNYSAKISIPENQKYTYIDKTTTFKIGDTLHYWLFVQNYDGKANSFRPSDYRQFTVTECPRRVVDREGYCKAPSPNEYEIPEPTVEILPHCGFKVSIPDQEGAQLFSFHGKLNDQFDGREDGHFSKNITQAKDLKWTFVNRDTRLKPGDILYFWLFVIRRYDGVERGYYTGQQMYVVSGMDEPTHKPCLISETKWNERLLCKGQLLFNETFDDFNPNMWTKEIRYADDPDYEFVIYNKFEENLYVKNGELHIKPTLVDDKYGEGFIYRPGVYDLGDSCICRPGIPSDCKRKIDGGYGLPPVFSARLNSEVSFTYGRVDIRAKFPKGDWIYPQLFLTPKNDEYGLKDYDSGEIRIAFVPGNSKVNNELQGMILLGTSPTARAYNIRRLKNPNGGWSDDFHVYSVIWTPDSLSFLVDNKEYGRIEPPPGGFASAFTKQKPQTANKWKSGGPLAPFDKEMFLKIGVGVGGHSFPESPDKPYTNTEAKAEIKFYRAKDIWKPTWGEDIWQQTGIQENELIVDYVKVYAL